MASAYNEQVWLAATRDGEEENSLDGEKVKVKVGV